MNKLLPYIPGPSFTYVSGLFSAYSFTLKITKPRRSKLGDYRAPARGLGHRISINGDLNKYSFLITLIHEIAHLTTWNKHRNKCEAHGKEWKTEFRNLLTPLLNGEIFPENILSALDIYIKNPAAASCSDHNLLRTLRMYDNKKPYVHLEDIPHGGIFTLKGGRKFIKGELLTKRYKCIEISSGLAYRVSPLAEVIPEPEQMKLFA